MALKTNVIPREFRFSVTAETKDGELKLFTHSVDAETEDAALLQLKGYLESRGLSLVDYHLPDEL